MTNLTTPHLKFLLDQATPGPWEYDPGDGLDGRYIGDSNIWGMCIGVEANGEGSDCSDADLALAAVAPELNQEVLRLREELIAWADDEARAHNALVERAQKEGNVGIITTHKTVYNRILEILGEHND